MLLLDAARITLNDHQTYDLSGFYLFFASNIGSQQLLRPTRLPFTTLERAVLAEVHRTFRPELIGRFDEKIVFKSLSPDIQHEIGNLVISDELARLNQKEFATTLSPSALEFLVRKGIHKTLGARPMRQTAQKFIGDAISQAIKSGRSTAGNLVVKSTGKSLTILPPCA
jgi:ATP-dependent Clp protease ATP-binding subunit ClpB